MSHIKECTLAVTSTKETHVVVGTELHETLSSYIHEQAPAQVLYIYDSNIADLFRPFQLTVEAPVLALRFSEKDKSLETFQDIVRFLFENNADKKTLVVAVGGGAITDAVGFACAVYHRGIPVVYVATSLLAQVDAATGGKNAINFADTKNILGTVYFPKMVLIDTDHVRTLPQREYESGMAEVVKHGLGFDTNLYAELSISAEHTRNKLPELIARSVELKINIVQQDFDESKYIRTLINFGHTLGQALEAEDSFSLTHGAAVSIGMLFATFVSHKKGSLTFEELDEALRVMQLYNLPPYVDFDCDAVLAKMRRDKKWRGDVVKFVLLEKVGHAYVTDMTYTELRDYLYEFKTYYDDLKKDNRVH